MRLGGGVGFNDLLEHRGDASHPGLELGGEVLHAHAGHLELGHFLHRQGIVRVGGDERFEVGAHGGGGFVQGVEAPDGIAGHGSQLLDRGFGVHAGHVIGEELFQPVDVRLDGGDGGFVFP